MSKSRNYELPANKGREQEKKYNWIAAIEYYEKALAFTPELNDFSKKARTCERIGFCYHRAAMQAKNMQEFKNRMLQAINAYNKAAKFFDEVRAQDPEMLAKVRHCKAVAAYLASWLKPDPATRKKSLDEFLKLEGEVLKFYEGTGDRLSLGKTYNELNTHILDRLNLEWDKHIRQKKLKESLGYGEKAIDTLSEQGDEYELGRAYCTASRLYYTAALGLEPEKKRKHEQKALDYSQKAVDLSQKIGDHLLLGMSNISLGSAMSDFADRPDIAVKHFETALQCGIHTRDNYLIGQASYLLAYLKTWKIFAEEDPEKKREESERCEKYCKDAIHHFSSISYTQEIASSYYWCAENYNILATSVETSSEKKRILLKKAIEAGRKGLEHARRSGSISATWFILHPLSKALFLLSNMETNEDAKKRLLEESSQYREENIKVLEQAMPYHFWNRGVYQNYLALIQAELAEIESRRTRKAELLGNAVKSAENCISLCSRQKPLRRGQLAALGRYYSDFGRILNRLYVVTGAHELLGRLIEVSKGAIETYQKADLPSRMAEGHWQLAKAHNKLQNYTKSAENFLAASKSYKVAAKKLPRLKGFYKDYAMYMQAWSKIEEARHAHAKEEHDRARKHYEEAAALHNSTKSWRYLYPNYLAWAQMEHGEDLSRKEQSEEAIEAFENAAELFYKAKQSFETELDKIQSADEKNVVMDLSKASDLRRKYCLGRITIEEAKILDRKDDNSSSSKRYGLAAKTFERVANAAGYKQNHNELRQTVYLCRAWEKMTLAEAEASSDLYLEAAELFEKAKKHSVTTKARILALANSCFCRALEAGVRFEATRERTLYLTATEHLEGAASYYIKAGFRSASEYAKATQRLFDAYAYVDDAKKERDAEKKAKYYFMAEKVLEASVGSYLKAKHPEKSDEVQRLLEDVREERQLAVSLCKVLDAPPIAATTATLSTPAPTREEATGLERFEQAEVHANLIISSKEVCVGEDLELEIELANTGRCDASLSKIEQVVPADFKLKAKPEMYRVEGHNLNMKGKRLKPLKTEDIKLVLKPLSKGTFILKPRITYLDEMHRYKACEPEPVTITVKELGIKGWIRGEG